MTSQQYGQYNGGETTNIMAMNTMTAIQLNTMAAIDNHDDNEYGDGDIIRYNGKMVRQYDQDNGDNNTLRYAAAATT
eukprot:CAMPEP_0172478674 /NCGR_PEP_ID=MMETSP1066-20121228/2766_1 /TAXON_ID=671091 /ORGANISM="Coscinodiscus wailesii, Strain CCMP2513" /LENGTH=76 /DNA_ID=CAMNT_0013238461 /DNA_START=551 /DNA_END=782 /DNA_ORIENTATION=+